MDWKPKPWIAAVAGLLLGPFGFLYVARPWLTLIYCVGGLLAGILEIWLTSGQLPTWWVGVALMRVLPSIHGYLIAKYARTTPRRPWYSRWWGTLAGVAMFFSLAFLLRSFIVEPFRNPSDSMHPGLRRGEYFLIKKWGYGHYAAYGFTVLRRAPTEKVARGDIVAFRLPQDERTSYVKRVIGLPGDRLEIRDTQVSINGVAVPTRCTKDRSGEMHCTETLDGTVFDVHYSPYPSTDYANVVPTGHYFMLGDNRNQSQDSRYIGPIPSGNIVGRLVYVVRRR